MDPLLHLAIRAFFAALFAAAIWHKLRDWRRFRRVVENFEIAPPALAPLAAVLALACEGVAFAALVFAPGVVAGPAAAALLGFYGALLMRNIARGRRGVDCGCSWVRSAGISPSYVIRNGALAALALLIAVPASARTPMAIDYANAIAFAMVAVSVYFLFDALLHFKTLEAAHD